MLTARRPNRGAADDLGFSLAETVVGITLMIIAGTIGLNMLLSMGHVINRTASQTSVVGADSTDTSFALEQLTTVLRLADTPTQQPGYSTARFLKITPTEIVFFSNLQPRSGTAVRIPPTKIDLLVQGGVLTEYEYSPLSAVYGANYDYASNYPSSPTSSVVLAHNIVNADVFGSCSPASDASTSCTSAGLLPCVAYVTVKLVVPNAPPSSASTTTSAPSSKASASTTSATSPAPAPATPSAPTTTPFTCPSAGAPSTPTASASPSSGRQTATAAIAIVGAAP